MLYNLLLSVGGLVLAGQIAPRLADWSAKWYCSPQMDWNFETSPSCKFIHSMDLGQAVVRLVEKHYVPIMIAKEAVETNDWYIHNPVPSIHVKINYDAKKEVLRVLDYSK